MTKISAVVCGRNDNYGGHLVERATYCFKSLLETFDEVIYVDWNTQENKEPLTSCLNIVDKSKLNVIVVTPEKVHELTNGVKTQPMCEVLTRNIGIRRATGDYIVSTNIDVITPERYLVDKLLEKIRPHEMITLAKQDVELSDLDKHFKNGFDPKVMPILFGLWPIQKRLMSPYLTINKDLLEKFPENSHHTLASIICACGDFQIAHRDTWWGIRGFEETMNKRSYADTAVQYKVLMNNGIVSASNFPPLYHIEHERDNNPNLQNSIEMNKKTKNLETWGFSHVEL